MPPTAEKTSVLAVLKACGGDAKPLITHAARLLADDVDGKLDAETEAMAQVVAGQFNGAVGVALARFLAAELLEAAKPEAAAIKKHRAEAIGKK